MIEILRVPPAAVDLVWPRVRDWIAAALPRDPLLYAPDDVRDGVRHGRQQLWVAAGDALEAVFVTELIDYPRARSCRVWLIGGRGLTRWAQPFARTIEGWARRQGCSLMEGGGRTGWRRVGGYDRDLGPVLFKTLATAPADGAPSAT